MIADEKKIKVITGEGQETFIPESIARDDATLKRLLASFYGTDNFRIERKDENGETIVRVVKMAGAKGQAPYPVQSLTNCPGNENPVIILYRELADVDITCLDAEAVQVLNKRMEDVLETGTKQYRRMESARMRLIHSTSTPAFLPIPGF